MKKLLPLMFCAAVLAGCGDSIPTECASTIKEYDSFLAELSKQDQIPAAAKEQMKAARDTLEQNIKSLSKDQAVQVCTAANASFEQMKKMIPNK